MCVCVCVCVCVRACVSIQYISRLIRRTFSLKMCPKFALLLNTRRNCRLLKTKNYAANYRVRLFSLAASYEAGKYSMYQISSDSNRANYRTPFT